MRSSIPLKARCHRFFGLGVALLLSVPAAAERTDVLILKNGDHITGEIKKLQRGTLEFKTERMGTLNVEWPAVARLTSSIDFEVVLDDGRKFYGTLAPDAEEGLLDVAGAAMETAPLPSVVEITPFEKSFLSQVNGSLSVGYSFAQSNTTSSWNAAANARYRTRNYLTTVSYSSLLNAQEGSATTTRNNLGLTFSRFLGSSWFAMGLAQFLQSSELGVDLRSTAGGALGNSIIRTNRAVLAPFAGIGYSNSILVGSTPSRNELLALAGVQHYLFTFGHHKTDLTTSFYVLPSLTESGHFRLEFQSDYRIKPFSDFYWNLNVFDSFDNDPPPGGARNDSGVTTSLQWSF